MSSISKFFQRLGINGTLLHIAESSLVVLFFLQALRFGIGIYYSRIASASLITTIQANANEATLNQLASKAGFVDPNIVVQEVGFLIYILAVPLIGLVVGRFRLSLTVAAILTALGRTLMIANIPITPATSAALTIGSGLLFVVTLIHHRPNTFVPMFLLALTADQLLRTAGNTLDPTWSTAYLPVQAGLAALVGVLAIWHQIRDGQKRDTSPKHGMLTVWGGIGLGAMLFLQIALLSTPNVVARRADISYAIVPPLVALATLAPLITPLRLQARQFIGLFDSSVRGWVWLLLTSILMVLGTRFNGTVAGVGLIGAQFMVSMLWWWFIRPKAENERNLSGLWIVLSVSIFAVLLASDILTYEYAYIQGITTGIGVIDNVVPTLLRGFRGVGYLVILLAIFTVLMPMIQNPKRLVWQGTINWLQTASTLLVIGGSVFASAYLATPPIIFGANDLSSLRVATYNIHGGYSEFYALNLDAVAQTIEQSGANVVLLQEAEAGRLTSFGIDQPLWLARRLGMDTRFFATNEDITGLAVLSNVRIVYDDGELLSGIGQQTGIQRVQVQPNTNSIVTLYNTWLGLLVRGESIEDQERDQQQQLNQIVRILSEHHPNGELGRTVIGGTFNNIPDSPLIERVAALGFKDPFAGFLIERSATLVRTGLSARIDYLWLYPDIAEGVGVIDTDASDHRLAFVSIALN